MDIDVSAVPANELPFLPKYIENLMNFGDFDAEDGWMMSDGIIKPRSDDQILLTEDYGDVGFFCRVQISQPELYLYYYDWEWASDGLWLIGLGSSSMETILSMLSRYCDHYNPVIPSAITSHVIGLDAKFKIFSAWKNRGLYASPDMGASFEADVNSCIFSLSIS